MRPRPDRRWRWLVTGLALALLSVSASEADQVWLLGRWEMTRDPDGGPKNWFEFEPDGTVISIKSDGQRMTGRYIASEAEVKVYFKVGTLSVITTLAADADGRHLYTRSARTGNTAVYEKQP
ncbi:MAG TPA: hypothetical protein VFT36_03355 [Methylomirabilota bacterium]|nr:hypothetical protein [Methylomirabilota bacterium]